MYTLLFVDDQREILNALRRTLMQQLDEWDVYVALGGDEALQMMETISFDVVVTDIKMPSMNGVDFLELVSSRHPDTLRFVLSGYTERDLIYKTIGNVHQFLSKPVDTEVLINTLKSAIQLRGLMKNEELRTLVSGLKGLPSLGELYQELMDALCSAQVSLNEVSDIVQKDVALSARVMHLVNSSFFGTPTYVTGPAHAVSLLGTEVMKGLVMSSFVFSAFDEEGASSFSIREFEKHCYNVGVLAKRIAEEETDNHLIIDDAFVAGLLHDVGKLILASSTPDEFEKMYIFSEQRGVPMTLVTSERFNATHAEIGSYLLGIWGFRNNIASAVGSQSNLDACEDVSFSPATAVHIANEFLKHVSLLDEHVPLDTLNERYLEKIGLSHRVDHWKKVCTQYIHTQLNYDREDSICG